MLASFIDFSISKLIEKGYDAKEIFEKDILFKKLTDIDGLPSFANDD